jgi:hypothetical protein
MRRRVLSTGLALMLCASLGCGKRSGGEQAVTSASPLESDDWGPIGYEYPPARWRLAMFDELDRATLWVGHIAIRHRLSQPDGFRILDWRPDPPNPSRSVAEALALAEKVGALAASAPNDFEQLARTYSEDIVSKDGGGALGGIRVSQLRGFDFLDALATLKPGEVSKPFRTPYGFHILKRYAPPAEEQVAGERIVIGYQGMFGLAKESQRSRAEAQRLARAVAEQAQQNPENFGTLVDRYSESKDRAQHGDLGVFSTRDPGYQPFEVYRLAGLAVGEVTGPIDTYWGFEILKRVAVVPRTPYAMTTIELPFDNSPAERAASQAQALAKAEELRRALDLAPNRFEEFQRIHCCEKVDRWTRGRGDLEVTNALDELSFGQIAPKPLLHLSTYLLIKRLDPGALPLEKPRLTEIPLPSEPNYDELLKHNDGTQIAGAARSLVEALKRGSELDPGAMRSIAETLGQLAGTLEHQAEDRAAVRASTYSALAVLESRLSAEQFSVFKTLSRRWAVQQMMPPTLAR